MIEKKNTALAINPVTLNYLSSTPTIDYGRKKLLKLKKYNKNYKHCPEILK